MTKKIFIILLLSILLLAIVFRIYIIEKIPLNDATQIDSEIGFPTSLEDYSNLFDINKYKNEDYGHLYYIMYIFQNHSIPTNSNGQTYHPPIHYIFSAIFLSIANIFPLNPMQKIESLQYLGLIYYILSIPVILKILKKLDFSKESVLLTMLIYSFFPKFLHMTILITNDYLSFIFMLCCLLCLLNWNDEANFKNAFIFSIFSLLGILTKYNAVIMLLPWFILFLYKLNKSLESDTSNSLKLIFQAVLVVGISFMSFTHILRDIYFEGNYMVPIPRKELYIGSYGFIKNWGIPFFDMLLLNNPNMYINIWYGALYDTLIAFDTRNILISILFFILLIFMFYGFVKNHDKKSLIIALTGFIYFISFILYNAKLTYICTYNTRYILISLLISIIFIGKSYETLPKRIQKSFLLIASTLFCLTSILSIIII